MTECIKHKIVVFDLDETLGYFSEFGMIWDAVCEYLDEINLNKNNQKNENNIDKQILFNNILDLFPEFLRPNILNILKYLKKKKQETKCNKLILYTNNQGPTEWAKSIIKYFDMKLNFKLFDQIIGAYKINGNQVEMCRTTHSKTHEDLLKCTKLSKNTEICFLDDLYHEGMDNENIYYINVKPYKYDINFTEIINRIINSNKININDEIFFREKISKILNKYHYTPQYKHPKEYYIDGIISKRIIHLLKDFFKENKNKTKKNKNNINKTRKNKKNNLQKYK